MCGAAGARTAGIRDASTIAPRANTTPNFGVLLRSLLNGPQPIRTGDLPYDHAPGRGRTDPRPSASLASRSIRDRSGDAASPLAPIGGIERPTSPVAPVGSRATVQGVRSDSTGQAIVPSV